MKIIYQTETGIAIIHPTGEVPIEVVVEKDVPTEYKHTACIVEDECIPTDRQFRDAWQFRGVDLINKTAISVNIDKAKEIHKGRLRADRKILLEDLDGKELQALRKNEDIKAIQNEKDRLCDITKLVDECTTIEEIKAIII